MTSQDLEIKPETETEPLKNSKPKPQAETVKKTKPKAIPAVKQEAASKPVFGKKLVVSSKSNVEKSVEKKSVLSFSKKMGRVADLSNLLKSYRDVVEEIITNARLRMTSDLIQIVNKLDEFHEFKGKERKRIPSAKALAGMTKKINKTRVKPSKGRIKDLTRIEKMLDSLIHQIDSNA